MRDPEIDAVIERYARRNDGDRCSPQRPEVRQMMEECRRAIVQRLAGRILTIMGYAKRRTPAGAREALGRRGKLYVKL